jgi:hypothetical protein
MRRTLGKRTAGEKSSPLTGARSIAFLVAVAIACSGLLLLATAASAQAALQNPGLEADSNGDSIPDYWRMAGDGTNSYQFTRTSDGHSGLWAERVDIPSLTSGDRKLITILDSAPCAQPVTPGQRYELSGWCKGNPSTQFVIYLRNSIGSWSYWTSTPRFPASSSWGHASWTTPAVPAESTHMGFGLNLTRAGSVTTDDYGLSELDTTPPDTMISDGPSGSTTATDAAFSFASSESQSTFTCSLDGSASPCTSPKTYSGLPVGQHTFTVAATDAAGNTDPTPATKTRAVQAPAPTNKTYSWGFDKPNCVGGLFGTEPWVSTPCLDSDWDTQGLFYSVPDSDSPTGTNVLVQNGARVDTMSTEQAWLHDPVTVDGSWSSEHRVDVDVKLVRWGSPAQSNCSWAGGPKLLLGRPEDKYETNTYTVELAICDGSAHIQKKAWAVDGKDRRAVDCRAGGTWYLLAQTRPGVPSFGVWHRFTAIKRDNPDGSVTLIGLRDGTDVIRYTEQPGSISLGPLRGGREGWRSNAIDWHMDAYAVTATP